MNSAQSIVADELIPKAVALLSQQLWCWGRDILRPEGNWLLEVGFVREPAPPDRKGCASLYTLHLPSDKHVVLRGFGVFFGASNRGGVFLPRYEFHPQFTPHSVLDDPPWTHEDLPTFAPPQGFQQSCIRSLVLELIEWIRTYEVQVLERLGIGYRQSTLEEWADGERSVIPAEELARAWRLLGNSLAEGSTAIVQKHVKQESR